MDGHLNNSNIGGQQYSMCIDFGNNKDAKLCEIPPLFQISCHCSCYCGMNFILKNGWTCLMKVFQMLGISSKECPIWKPR